MQTMTLFSGLALREVLENSLIPPFVAQTGVAIRRVYEPTSVLRDLVRQGEQPDVIIGTSVALDEMAAEGEVRPESIRTLVRSDIGIAMAPAAPTYPLATPADLGELLHRVGSVAYSAAGASGAVFERVLGDLDLAEVVRPKAVVLASGFTAEAVRDGRAEIAVQQISELAAVEGISILGSLPAELGAHIELSAAIGVHADDPAIAQRFIREIRSDRHRDVYARAHLVPLTQG